MRKVDFISRLKSVRKTNGKKIKGRIKKRYKKIDDELSWRLFQLFPVEWKDSDRFKGMTLVITHITSYVLSRIDINFATEDIVNELYIELRTEFDYMLGKRYIRELVNQIIRIKLLNS